MTGKAMKRHLLSIAMIAVICGLCCWAQITSVASNTLAAGAEVTIAGFGFGDVQGKNSLWIGGKEAVVLSWSNTAIVAQVPVGSFSNEVAVRSPNHVLQIFRLPIAPAFARAPTQPSSNGILVDGIKVYDDQALQQALNLARTQLAAIQVINGAGINAQVGTLQGATLSQSAFALNIGTPPTPGITSTANTGNAVNTTSTGANSQQNSGNTVTTNSNGTNNQVTNGSTGNNTVVTTTGGTNPNTVSTVGGTTSSQNQTTTTGTNNVQVTGPSTQLTTTANNQTVTTGPSLQTVTTQAATTPTVPTITPSTLALPSSYSPGASAILNEQLELTYEITGYELLLEGALSDHYARVLRTDGSVEQRVRPRATIGVPITISPGKSDREAVAEVILEVSADPQSHETPIVTAILPRDKTYNVASITDKSVSIGGAVATQVISLGASALWGHKSYFVVQDQDTVALQFPTSESRVARFGWQIRPVLGQKVVTSGMRNCFVQLAFADRENVPVYGQVRVTTVWKKYDTKRGIVLGEIPGTRVESAQTFDIPRFQLTPVLGPVSYEDNADGTVTVAVGSLGGAFLDGTFAKVGGLTFVPGINGTVQDPSGIRFALPAILLATHNGYVVDRSGEATEIVDPPVQGLKVAECLGIGAITTSPAGAGLTKLTIPIAITDSQTCKPGGSVTEGKDLVAVVGNQVFGLRNLPFFSATKDAISFMVPTGLLQNSRHVTVKRLLWGKAFENGTNLDENTFRVTPVVGQATVVYQDDKQLQIALMGTGLQGLTKLLPATVTFDPKSDSGAILKVPKADLKGLKQIVLTDPAGELFLVTIPADPTPPTVPQLDAVTKGQASITVPSFGPDLHTLSDVRYANSSIGFNVAADGKSVTVDIKAVTGISGTKNLTFVFSGGKNIQIAIAVVDSAIKIQQQAPAPTK